MSKAYKTLYKLNSNGSTQVWSIFKGKDNYWTEASKLGGKVIVSAPTMVTPKQKRTLSEQIDSEVESKIKKQRDKRYVDDVKDIAGAGDALPGYTPMLAKKYNAKKVVYPCIAQPKLDGIRCLATKDGMFSRGRKQFDSCTHIWEELKPLFDEDPSLVLDGELYSHAYKNDFEKICKAVKKSAAKATAEHRELQKRVEYHVYDMPKAKNYTETDSFTKRFTHLKFLCISCKYMKVVETKFNVVDYDGLVKYKEAWVEDGYEGAIIRNTDMPYENKRSNNLQKLKDFEDAEFTIVGINEGSGSLAGHAGSFICRLDKNRTFDAKLKGSFRRLRAIFENPDDVIGKKMTVRYQNLTADLVPRFPVGIAIRDYE